ncbi:MAG: glycosyl transferase [Roseburia sp.]|nr:glycosyl transferase [Roseburia sp.]
MNILILSCNTGEGHNAAARAVEEAALARGHEVRLVDMMSLVGERVSRLIGGGYVNVAKNTPLLFGFVYQLGRLISSPKRKSPVYYANALVAKALAAYLEEYKADVIITPHLYPAETTTYMKRKGMLSIKVIAIATDYTCIPFWEETECDYYIVPHRDCVKEFVKRGVPAEKLLPYGIPVDAAFEKQVSKKRARRKLKLPADGNLYLIMSGSMGFGKVKLFSRELAERIGEEDGIVIVCGNNEALRGSLQKKFQDNGQIRIVGFTRHVADYMSAADVIYTKPGGLSSTEALIKNLPIVHTAPIPGCETRNRIFFRRRGMSVSASEILVQIHKGRELVENDRKRAYMLRKQVENMHHHAAEKIVELAEKSI